MPEPSDQNDSFRDDQEPKSSTLVWDALQEAKREFQTWWNICDRIDRIIDATRATHESLDPYFTDQEFDLYWSSLEIIKPAVYSRPPQPVVSPRFPDRDKVAIKASEVLERCLVSSFDRGDFDQVMLGIRDDLCINGRGVSRVYYETGGKHGKRVCDEHVDRTDFLHEPARKWSEVGWVAFGAHLTRREFEKRFPNADADKAQFTKKRDDADSHRVDTAAKCKVWEVWHKADDKVYWVTEGVDTFLDESAPFLEIEGFYPCPRPAYGTLKRRQLIPVPDYVRYQRTLEQINELTRRVHALLGWIKVKGLIPAGGDVGAAVETALSDSDGNDDVLLIPIPAAALMQGSGQFVQFLPLQEFAQAITGLLDARRELIQNFYELSGISDIMRGATQAEETLGAQQLKSQFGSVRVREKIDELQRVARDAARITAEIIAEKFDKDTIMDMAQMVIPSKAEIEKDLKELRSAAEKELKALEEQATQAADQAQASGQEFDPKQAEQAFNQAQQQILAKYQPQIKELGETCSIEEIMALFRDQKARAFAIDIETDSTIMVDEIAEKQSRAEFLTAFSNASAAIQPLLMAGEAGATLAGGMLKFALAPYRAGRELDGMIDDFVETAPQMMQQQGGGEAEQALVEAQNKLAEAEIMKANAQTQKVTADAQGKMQELTLRAKEAETKAAQDAQRFKLEIADTRGKLEKTEAEVRKIMAEIRKMGFDMQLEGHKEQREDIKTVADIEGRQQDRQMAAQDAERDAAFRAQDGQRAERQQEFSERSGDRQLTLAEKQAQRETNDA